MFPELMARQQSDLHGCIIANRFKTFVFWLFFFTLTPFSRSEFYLYGYLLKQRVEFLETSLDISLRQALELAPRLQNFFMLNSVEHDILNVHKYKHIKKLGLFSAQISLECFFPLINVKMPTVGILTFMSRKIFILS